MDEIKLARYIQLYHNAVYRLAYSYLKNTADADDVCSETFFKLYQYNGSFQTDENCKRWLLRVAVNISKNLVKSVWYSKRSELEEKIPLKTHEEYDLSEKLSKLSPKYRVVIHLYYFEDYSVNEISEILKISVSTVTTRLNRARKQLKVIFEKELK